MKTTENEPAPRKPSHLTDFAALIGSKKGTWPIPPDQLTTYQDKRYSPGVRLWSWLVEHSIAPASRTGPATLAGRPATLHDAAKALRIDPGNIRRAWRDLEREDQIG